MNYQETIKFLISNKETIITQITEKLKPILIHKDVEENSSTYWFNIIEPGWDPAIIKENSIELFEHPELNVYPPVDNSPNELLVILNSYYEESIKSLNLPIDIMH